MSFSNDFISVIDMKLWTRNGQCRAASSIFPNPILPNVVGGGFDELDEHLICFFQNEKIPFHSQRFFLAASPRFLQRHWTPTVKRVLMVTAPLQLPSKLFGCGQLDQFRV